MFFEELNIIHYTTMHVYTCLNNEKFTETEVYQFRSQIDSNTLDVSIFPTSTLKVKFLKCTTTFPLSNEISSSKLEITGFKNFYAEVVETIQ